MAEHLEDLGLGDFGDTHIGHPALDWRWPKGYCGEIPATDEFMAASRTGLILNDRLALATRPDRRTQVLGWLQDLLNTCEPNAASDSA